MSTNKMLVQASDIEKWTVYFDVVGFLELFRRYQSLPLSFQNIKPNQESIWFTESGGVLKAMI